MEAIREIIGKNKDKAKRSKEEDDCPSRGLNSDPAYRSSKARGEPEVGNESYSRDTGVSRSDWEGHRQRDLNPSSQSGEARNYSSESSGSAGLGSDKSVSGLTDGSGYGYQAGYSSMSDDANEDTYSSGSSDRCRRDSKPVYSRRSNHDDDASGTRRLYGSASHSGGMSGYQSGHYASGEDSSD